MTRQELDALLREAAVYSGSFFDRASEPCADMVCRLSEALRALTTPRPMAEAPRDGTRILTIWEDGIVAANWHETVGLSPMWARRRYPACGRKQIAMVGWLPLPPLPAKGGDPK